MRTPLIPMLDASHSISKILEKSSKARSGALHNLYLSESKASCCSLPHLKPTLFLIISINGAVMVLKSLMNLL
uniref:Uncharacterized protein n=1 Tax=Rhizophora mucronata TaxID=61149 RepID=A0A2P2QZ20_RHIMU